MIFRLLLVLLVSVLTASIAYAERLDFGGSDEAFKGNGDNTPPKCQVEYPRAATEPFFITWNCEDDVAIPGNIRTELWINRLDNDLALRRIGAFLGFPAGVNIDESVLQVTDFSAGLPASFRVVAIDGAGNATATPFFQVRLTDNASLTECDVSISTEATESDGGTTGTPALSLVLTDAAVISSQFTNSDATIASEGEINADPCEFTTQCADGSDVTFSLTLSIEDDQTATGSFALTPGTFESTLEGSVVRGSSGSLTSASLSGTGLLETSTATVNVSCSQ